MGFDLIGVSPWSIEGSYFTTNAWSWRPLWSYVCQNCSEYLTKDEMEQGEYNNGYHIVEGKSIKISNRLFELLESGEVRKDVEDYHRQLSDLPLEPEGLQQF